METSETIENRQSEGSSEMLLYAAWFVGLTATVGSLFFSEVMELPPCVLCWYQRIAMYPLVVVLGAGIIMRDYARVKFYALPLAAAGLAIAIYHNLLYYGIIPESITPCTQGISCTSRQIEWLGFITIPLLSLTAFTIITGFLLFYKAKRKENLSTDEHR
jgi:disulfide bond formation protein DsbB